MLILGEYSLPLAQRLALIVGSNEFTEHILIKTNSALDSATHALRFLTKAYQGASYTSGVKNPEKALIAFRLHRKRSRSDAAKKGKRIAQKFLDLEHSPKK